MINCSEKKKTQMHGIWGKRKGTRMPRALFFLFSSGL